MNLDRIIAVIIRTLAVNFLFTGITYITYLPDRFAYLAMLKANHRATYPFELELQGLFLRMILNVVFGTYLFVGWKRFVRFLTKDIAVQPVNSEQQR